MHLHVISGLHIQYVNTFRTLAVATFVGTYVCTLCNLFAVVYSIKLPYLSVG